MNYFFRNRPQDLAEINKLNMTDNSHDNDNKHAPHPKEDIESLIESDTILQVDPNNTESENCNDGDVSNDDSNKREYSIPEWRAEKLPKSNAMREVSFSHQIEQIDASIWDDAKKGKFDAKINIKYTNKHQKQAIRTYLENKGYDVEIKKSYDDVMWIDISWE
jgi:hypothetical protein